MLESAVVSSKDRAAYGNSDDGNSRLSIAFKQQDHDQMQIDQLVCVGIWYSESPRTLVF